MVRSFLFSLFFFIGIILISIIFVPSFFLPQKIVLIGGKLMGYWSSFCLKFFLSTKIVIKGEENIIQDEKVKVYVEPLSELYLVGTEIDYLKEDYSKGIFESKFVYNVDKKMASTCGCGVSFTPRKL